MESAASDTASHRPTLDPRPERRSIVPPYWQRHERTSSNLSFNAADRNSPIRLEDHTDDGSEQCRALWAKHVTIDDYVIVGTPPALGAYVVWNCTVETLDGGPMKIIKRYSEFEHLRHDLVKTFPHATGSMPPLPPKSIFSKFQTKFLEKRKAGLAYFLNCVLLNPEFAGSPVLKEFLFS
ncbi:Phox-like protein [Melanomma pulvis-pyrius CBS 109.77]|uniref:Endosomal/vacuolar adapter protein YPT35 n=1 Tax=Melanomma pulvis-pyrius CBS 109.77 TaxID=1314802 RepID=A0A6A6XMA1_9PLEO|nr:Phox-like protein [Melanomma pulvis-pyrius CBS 109.77]